MLTSGEQTDATSKWTVEIYYIIFHYITVNLEDDPEPHTSVGEKRKQSGK